MIRWFLSSFYCMAGACPAAPVLYAQSSEGLITIEQITTLEAPGSEAGECLESFSLPRDFDQGDALLVEECPPSTGQSVGGGERNISSTQELTFEDQAMFSSNDVIIREDGAFFSIKEERPQTSTEIQADTTQSTQPNEE